MTVFNLSVSDTVAFSEAGNKPQNPYNMDFSLNAELTNNIIDYFKFDESSGNRVSSVTSNFIAPSTFGAAATGHVNGAFGIPNTASGFNSLSDDGTLRIDPNKDFTIGFLLQDNSVNSVVASSIVYLDSAGEEFISFRRTWNNPNSTYTVYFNGSSTSLSVNLTQGWWYHLALTVTGDNGSRTLRLYSNGLEVGNTTLSAHTFSASKRINISSAQTNTGANSTLFDEFGVWQRVFTASEVIDLVSHFYVIPQLFNADYFPLEEATASNRQSIGIHNTGTSYLAPTHVSQDVGVINNGAAANNTTADDDTLTGNLTYNSFSWNTIAGWFKINGSSFNTTPTNLFILNSCFGIAVKGTTSGGKGPPYDIGVVTYNSGTSSYTYTSSVTTIAADTWFHVVIVKHPRSGTTTQYDIYVNGSLAKSVTDSNNIESASGVLSTRPLQGTSGATWYDELAYWVTSLSASEISYLYHVKKAYQYPFDDKAHTLTDWVGYSELLSYIGPHIATTNDTITLSESLIRLMVFLRPLSDTVTFSEALHTTTPWHASSSDTVTFSESLHTTTPWHTSASDTVTFSEVLSRVHIALASASDTVSFTDSIATHNIFKRSSIDTVTLTDTPSHIAIFTRPMSETITFTDTVSTPIPYHENISDTVTFSETPFTATPWRKSISETVTFTELIVDHHWCNARVSDTVTFTDSMATHNVFKRSDTETVTFTEALVGYTLRQSIKDTVTFSEKASEYMLRVNVSDTITFTEKDSVQMDITTGTQAHTVTDWIGFSEILHANMINMPASDTITFTDSVAQPSGTIHKSASDIVTFSETLYSNHGLSFQLYDAVFFFDNASTTTPWHATANDTIIFFDLVNNHTFSFTVNDTVYFVDLANGKQVNRFASATDTVFFTDKIPFFGKPIHVTASDTIRFTEGMTHYSPYHAVAGPDTIRFTDSVRIAGPKYANATDTITFGEQYTQFHQLSLVDTIIFTDTVKPSSKIFANATDTIVFGDSMSIAQPKSATVADTITFTEIVFKNAALAINVIDCILLYDDGAKSLYASASDTILFTGVALVSKFFLITEQILFTEVVTIPGFNFFDFPCERDTLNLNSPLITDSINFTDAVVLNGGYTLPLLETIKFHDKVVGFKININGR